MTQRDTMRTAYDAGRRKAVAKTRSVIRSLLDSQPGHKQPLTAFEIQRLLLPERSLSIRDIEGHLHQILGS